MFSPYVPEAQLEKVGGRRGAQVTAPTLFLGDLMLALLLTAFCLHFPTLRRSTLLELIIIVPMVPLYYNIRPLSFAIPCCILVFSLYSRRQFCATFFGRSTRLVFETAVGRSFSRRYSRSMFYLDLDPSAQFVCLI